MITWKDPPAATGPPLVDVLFGEVKERPGVWAVLRVCPTSNAARNAKRRLLRRLVEMGDAGLFEVRAVGVELYGRAKKQPTLYDR